MRLPIDLEATWYTAEWGIRIGALVIVPSRRSPAATRAWLLLIFFLPLPGLLLFWAIGSPRFPAWRTQRFFALAPFYEAVAGKMKHHTPDFGAAAASAALATTLGRIPVTDDNAIDLIDNYDRVIDLLVADVDEASSTIDLLVYIFADVLVGQRIVDALGMAVMHGVRVRVMFDPIGSH